MWPWPCFGRQEMWCGVPLSLAPDLDAAKMPLLYTQKFIRQRRALVVWIVIRLFIKRKCLALWLGEPWNCWDRRQLLGKLGTLLRMSRPCWKHYQLGQRSSARHHISIKWTYPNHCTRRCWVWEGNNRTCRSCCSGRLLAWGWLCPQEFCLAQSARFWSHQIHY